MRVLPFQISRIRIVCFSPQRYCSHSLMHPRYNLCTHHGQLLWCIINQSHILEPAKGWILMPNGFGSKDFNGRPPPSVPFCITERSMCSSKLMKTTFDKLVFYRAPNWLDQSIHDLDRRIFCRIFVLHPLATNKKYWKIFDYEWRESFPSQRGSKQCLLSR